MLAEHHLDRRLPPGELAAAAATIGVREVQGSAALALAARVEGFAPDQLEDALERKTLVGVAGPRGNPTLVPARDAAVFTVGALPQTEESLRLFLAPALAVLDAAGVTATEALDRACDAAATALATGPLTPGALATAMTKARPELSAPCRGRCGAVHVDVGLFDLVGVAGVWCLIPGEHGRLHVRSDQWLAPEAVPDLGVAARRGARRELVRRYVRAYGPPAPADLSKWAHLARAEAAEALAAAGVEGDGSARDEVAGVRLLPPHDPYLEGRNRAALLPDRAAQRQLWRAQANPGAVLVDGGLVATWRARKKGSHLTVRVTPLGAALSRRVLARVDEEAEAIAPLRGCTSAAVEST